MKTRKPTLFDMLEFLISLLAGIIILFISLRFFCILLGATMESPEVKTLYSITDKFLIPFTKLPLDFQVFKLNDEFSIEINSLLGILVCTIITGTLLYLIRKTGSITNKKTRA